MDLSTIPTNDLVNELIKRNGVTEYKHGETSELEISRWRYNPDKTRYLDGYKILKKTMRCIVVG